MNDKQNAKPLDLTKSTGRKIERAAKAGTNVARNNRVVSLHFA